jgi:hypothetical protein
MKARWEETLAIDDAMAGIPKSIKWQKETDSVPGYNERGFT